MADPVSLGLTIALTAAQMGLQASRKIEGPRLTDLTTSLGDPGDSKNYFLGTRRFDSCSFLFAEDLREVKRKRKTKGGKYNEYTYFGTWANHVADHPIDAVTRIWLDKHLVYDATGAGPLTAFGSSVGLSDFLRIMLGGEDQEPDPRMLLTIEALHGEGSCPAYRGQSLVVWEEVPLEKFGNRLPQPTIEATRLSVAAYPYEIRTPTIDPPNGLDSFGFAWSPDRSRFLWSDGDEFEIWDTAARASMVKSSWATLGLNSASGCAIANSGRVYGIGYTNPATETYLVSYDPDGIGGGAVVADLFDGGNNFAGKDLVICRSVTTGAEVIGVKPYSIYRGLAFFVLGAAIPLYLDTGPLAWQPASFFADLDGNVWAVGAYQSDTILAFQRIYGSDGDLPGYFEVTGMPNSQGISAQVTAFHYRDAAVDHFVVFWNGDRLIAIDLATQTAGAPVTVTTAEGTSVDSYIENVVPGAATFWIDTVEYRSADLSVARAYTDADLAGLWVGGSSISGTFHDPINHALVSTAIADGTLTWRYLDRISGDGVTIAAIIDMVSDMAGVDGGDYHAALCTDTLDGFSFTAGAAKAILSPVLEAHDIDPVSEDFLVRFRPRGTASEGVIPTGRLVRRGESRFAISVAKDEDLPLQVTMAFADVDRDQQDNIAESARSADAVRTKRITQIDMRNVATDTDNARQLADRFMRRQHYEKESYDLAVSDRYLKVTPGSVYTLGLDEIDRTARCVSARIGADRVTETRWVRDHPSLAGRSTGVGAPLDSRLPSRIAIPGLSKGFVIDAPLAMDADDSASPFLMVAAAPYSDDVYWTGADIWASDSGDPDEFDPGWAAVPYQSAATWGYCTDILGDALPWAPDNGNVVTVFMAHGELSSVPMDALLLDATLNLLLVGGEYVQFATATLIAPKSYELSGLLRGRRGTEQHVATHAVGDAVLLIDDGIIRRGVGVSEIGDTDYYKAVSQGRDDSSAPINIVTFTAAAQKPYAPVHGALTLDGGSGDWSIDAVRRTRLGGANVDGQDVPLGETAESWSCDIMDGAAVIRTLTGDSLPLTYGSAAQTVDFGAPQTSLTVNLHQVSPALALRGFPLAIAA